MLITCAQPLRLPARRYSIKTRREQTSFNNHVGFRFPKLTERRRNIATFSWNPESEDDWEQLPPGSKEVQAAVQATQLLVRQGDTERAKEALKTAISLLSQQYGSTVEHLGILHTQLYLLYFVEGQYKEALQQAQDSYRCTANAMGEDSGEAVLLGLRVGIASLAAGDPEGAEPYLMAAGAVLEEQMNMMRQELAQLMQQGVQPAQVMEFYNDVVQCVIREHDRLVADASGAASLRLAKQHEELVQALQSQQTPYMP